MPLFYLATWLLARLGNSEILLRLPSAIAGTLLVLAVFYLGRRLFGTRAGVTAGLLAAFVPFSIWFSQDARNYAFFMLFTTLQMLAAYQAVKEGRVRDWAALAVATSLNLYTHYVAFVPTAAAAAYVGAILLARLLAGSERRRARITLAVLAVAAAVAAVLPWRSIVHQAARASTSLALGHRTIGLALAALAATALAAAAAWLAIRFLRPPAAPARQLRLAFLSGLLAAVSYLPWLPSLLAFTGNPGQSVGRYDVHHHVTLAEVESVVGGLDVTGVLAIAFAVGVIGLGVQWRRGRREEAALLVAWIGVSVVALLVLLRGSITLVEVRYFAFLVPAALLVMGLGVETAFGAARFALERLPQPAASGAPAGILGAILVAAVLAQPVLGVGDYYATPKIDYRSIAQRVAAAGPGDSVVLTLGDHPDQAAIGLDYYFHRLRAPIDTLDARQMDGKLADRLLGGGVSVWVALAFPSAQQLALLSGRGPDLADLSDGTGAMHAVRDVGGGRSPVEQAEALLAWDAPVEPELAAPRALLELASGAAQAGPQLLPAGASPIMVSSKAGAGQALAIASAPVQAGSDYVLSFQCPSVPAGGSAAVFAVVRDLSTRALAYYPTGAGYACPTDLSGRPARFAFHALPGAATVELYFRAAGGGTASFGEVTLFEPQPAGGAGSQG